MALDIARLRVLVEVAHAGSIAAAAQRMSFTASALSQQLTKLERELGCRLVERGPGGARLTPPGEMLLRHAERVLGELRDAEDAVRAATRAEPEHLSIGAFATAAQTLVPDALAVLRENHPDVRLSLVDLEPPHGYGQVTSRDLDLLITHHYPGAILPADAGLQRRLLLDDPLELVLPSSHPLASREHLTRTDLAKEDWISGAHGVPNRVCLETLFAPGSQPHVAYETSDYEVTLSLVRAGLGISLVPATVRPARAGVTVCKLPGAKPMRKIYLVHRRRSPPLVSELIMMLREVADAVAPAVATLNGGPRAASTL